MLIFLKLKKVKRVDASSKARVSVGITVSACKCKCEWECACVGVNVCVCAGLYVKVYFFPVLSSFHMCCIDTVSREKKFFGHAFTLRS